MNTDTTPEETITKSRITEPEWRELGPDEVIQEGDEILCAGGGWVPAKLTIGDKVKVYQPHLRFRTRRPFPQQEEMPMDVLNYHIMLCEDAGESDDLLQCIRYLRDEIEKLKNK